MKSSKKNKNSVVVVNKYRTSFHNPVAPFVAVNSGEEHPRKETTPPLSPAQMLRRLANGQPISASKPTPNMPINHKFFTEKFDVIDTAIRLNKKLRVDEAQKAKVEREKQKQLHKEFLEWKKNQDVIVDPPKSVDSNQQSNT